MAQFLPLSLPNLFCLSVSHISVSVSLHLLSLLAVLPRLSRSLHLGVSVLVYLCPSPRLPPCPCGPPLAYARPRSPCRPTLSLSQPRKTDKSARKQERVREGPAPRISAHEPPHWPARAPRPQPHEGRAADARGGESWRRAGRWPCPAACGWSWCGCCSRTRRAPRGPQAARGDPAATRTWRAKCPGVCTPAAACRAPADATGLAVSRRGTARAAGAGIGQTVAQREKS